MKSLLVALTALVLSIDGTGGIAAGDVLRIDVVALDARGAPVLDLRPGEFEVWINGFQIPIETVTFVAPGVADASRTIVLLLDDMSVTQTLVPRVREAARRLVERTSDADRVSVMSLNSGVREDTDRDLVLRAIDRYHVSGFPMRIDVAGEQVLKQ